MALALVLTLGSTVLVSHLLLPLTLKNARCFATVSLLEGVMISLYLDYVGTKSILCEVLKWTETLLAV